VPELTGHNSIRNKARQGKTEYPGHNCQAWFVGLQQLT
jgi:hypothetical protein